MEPSSIDDRHEFAKRLQDEIENRKAALPNHNNPLEKMTPAWTIDLAVNKLKEPIIMNEPFSSGGVVSVVNYLVNNPNATPDDVQTAIDAWRTATSG